MSRVVVTAMILLVSTGCVSATPLNKIRFEEELAGDVQAKQDRYECMRDAETALPPAQFGNFGPLNAANRSHRARDREALFVACMEARGWTRD